MTTTTVPHSLLWSWRPSGADGTEGGDVVEDTTETTSGTEDKSAEEDQSTTEAVETVSKKDFDELQAKFDQMKTHLSANDKSKAELQKKLDEHERKGKTDLENAQADVQRLTEEAGTWRGRYEGLARTNSFLVESARAGIAWHDPEVALAAASGVRELTIGDDGAVDGMAALVKKLAKDRPFLVNGSRQTEDDGKQGGTNGSATGSKVGKGAGAKGKPGELSREELIKKFPSLRE